jgi:hypothetical protein
MELVGRTVRGRKGAVVRKDSHDQVTPGGEVHVHLGGAQEVLP